MSATAAQRQFNRHPGFRPVAPDIWHRYSKEAKRQQAVALIYCYLVGGGKITRPPEKKKRGPGRPQIFGKDTKSASYSRDMTRFYSGHDLTQSGPRWTSRPVRDDSAAKRDAGRQAGVSHADFSGAVIQIGNKLAPRQAEPEIIRDQADSIVDASARATIRDDISPHIDQEHMRRLKLAG